MDSRVMGFRQALDASKVPALLYGVLALIALLLITDGYGTQSIGFVAPVLVKALALKKGAMTPVITFGLIGVMIGACGVSPVADRIGARRILIACAVSYGLLMIATGFVRDVNSLLALRFLSGMALGGAMPVGIALVSEYSPTRLRATLVTVAVCGFSVGSALGGVVASLAIKAYGWPSVFFIGGAAPLLLAPVLFAVLPESLPVVLAGKASARAMAATRKLAPAWTPSTAPLTAGHGADRPVAGLFENGLTGATLLIWVVYFMNLMVLYTLSQWLPTIMTGAGMTLASANVAASAYQLAGTFGGLLVSFAADRFGSRLVIPLVFLAGSAACFLLGAAGLDSALMVAAVSAAGFCVVGGQGAANAFVGNFYPSYVRATGIGWALGIGRLGTILGAYVIGALHDQGATPRTLFELCAAPGLFAAVAIWVVARGRRAPAPAAEAAQAKA